MKTVAFVPIKLNNERFPGKNIKRFNDGTPLIQVMLKTLAKIPSLDQIYVYCSDEQIKKYLIENVNFLERPLYLDKPTATPQDIIKEFMKSVNADIYMVSHVTSPFVKQAHLEECIKAVTEKGHDSSFTASMVQKLLWLDRKPYNFDAANIPRTQELQPIYAEVGAAYVFKKEVFLEYNRRIGINPHIVRVSDIEALDIDYPEDFQLANLVYKELINK